MLIQLSDLGDDPAAATTPPATTPPASTPPPAPAPPPPPVDGTFCGVNGSGIMRAGVCYPPGFQPPPPFAPIWAPPPEPKTIVIQAPAPPRKKRAPKPAMPEWAKLAAAAGGAALVVWLVTKKG